MLKIINNKNSNEKKNKEIKALRTKKYKTLRPVSKWVRKYSLQSFKSFR